MSATGSTEIRSSSGYASFPGYTTQRCSSSRSFRATRMERVVPGASASLHSNPVTLPAPHDEQVELGAAVRRPEVHAAGLERARELLDREPLERGADLGVAGELIAGLQGEEGVQQPGVAHVDPGRLHLTLAHVREPRRERPHHERAGEDVEISSRRAFARSERARELRRVPHLAVIVGQHRPEPSKGLGRNRDAELGDVALQERLHEAAPPHRGRAVVRGEICTREAAAEPEGAPRLRRDLRQVEPREIDETHAAGERFRDPPNERRRCAAEHEKPRRIVGPVGEHAKRLEERRFALYLVDDHEAGQAAQCLLGCLQPPSIHRTLQIEERASLRVGSRSRDRARERGLSALARSGQSHRGMDGKRLVDAGAGAGDGQWSCGIIFLENPQFNCGFSRNILDMDPWIGFPLRNRFRS